MSHKKLFEDEEKLVRDAAEAVARLPGWHILPWGTWKCRMPLFNRSLPIDELAFAAQKLAWGIPTGNGLRRRVVDTLRHAAEALHWAREDGERKDLTERLHDLRTAIGQDATPPALPTGADVECLDVDGTTPTGYRGTVEGDGSTPRLVRVLITQEPPTDNAVLTCLGKTLEIDVGDLRVA
jgi:hypothetical protein